MYGRWIRPRVESWVIRRAIASAVEESYRDDARRVVRVVGGPVRWIFTDDSVFA
jgi:hypothetical protein